MSTHDGVYITNMAGEIIFVNKSFCQTYGYEEAEILGKNYRLLQDSLRGDAKQKKISTGQLKISEIIHKRKDGSTFPISLSTSMIKDDNKRGVALVSVVRDISERKQAEAQREKLIAELQESLAKVKRLKGLLPICASCKNIRNDQGYWQEVEVYIREHAEVDFSHGICPDCTAKLYPDIYQKSLERKQDIVNALNELKRADLTAISAAVGLPESNTENRLRDMVKAGTVKRLELSGRTFYELPKG